jgi:5-methylcytosine-specific restriction enzyme A
MSGSRGIDEVIKEDKPRYKTKKEKKRLYNSAAWQKLRAEALARDNHECIWCKEKGRLTLKQHMTLEIDHILEIETHPERALDLDNLRTLCRRCHNRRHGRLQFREQQQKQEKKWDDESFD